MTKSPLLTTTIDTIAHQQRSNLDEATRFVTPRVRLPSMNSHHESRAAATTVDASTIFPQQPVELIKKTSISKNSERVSTKRRDERIEESRENRKLKAIEKRFS